LIVGDGLIGLALAQTNHNNVVVFASGVSSSTERDPRKFVREEQLLLDKLGEATTPMYYVSTCSIFDNSLLGSPYINHKKNMEEIVLSRENGFVIRLPNIVGSGGNSSNLVNYVADSIRNHIKMKIQREATRYILGVDEMRILIQELIAHGSEAKKVTSFVPPRHKRVTEIIEVIESILEENAVMELVDEGTSYSVDFNDTKFYANRAKLNFGPQYYEETLAKWCKKYD
jgi:hypothetical protein